MKLKTLQTSLVLVLALVLSMTGLKAQIVTPVKWSYGFKKTGPNAATLFLKATIDDGWHIYSVNQKDGGPVKTSFVFASSPDYAKLGKVTEPAPATKMDDTFGIEVSTFEKSVIFQQKITLKKQETQVKGKLTYMVCNDHECLPPETLEFSIPIK